MQNLEKLEKKLKEAEVDYTIHNFGSAYEGVGAKYTEGLSTLIFKADGKYLEVLKRDDRKVDFKKVKQELDIDNLELASKEDLTNLGFKSGAVSPLLLDDIEIVVDKSVENMEVSYSGTGSPEHTLEMRAEDLLKVLDKYDLLDITKVDKNKINKTKMRILTGDTPTNTGRLHLGHYVGALEDRVQLQDKYETYVIIANLHAYANYYKKSEKINSAAYQTFLDNLAVGIDPEKAVIFLETGVPEIFEFYSFFMTMVRMNRAVRNPTIKEEIEYKKLDPSLAFVAYPILQAADILAFDADLVPVGEDQLPVLEQVREIARDFNKTYGRTFTLPNAKVGRVARLVGIDGKGKMSKSGGNAIFLSDDRKTLKKKVMSMFTDPNRVHPTDPGKVENNPVFIYHDAFNPNKDEVEDLKKRYRKGKVGDVEVKKKLFKVLDNLLEPIRQKRKKYENDPKLTKSILIEGTRKARTVVQKMLVKFKDNVGINKLVS